MQAGGLSIQDEVEDVEEEPLVRHRTRRTSSGSPESAQDVGVIETSTLSSITQPEMRNQPDRNENSFPSDEV